MFPQSSTSTHRARPSEMAGEFINQTRLSFADVISSLGLVKTLEWRRNWWSSPKFTIPAFTIVGIIMAIVHHALYTHLDGKTVNANWGRHGQSIVSALGTFIAYIGRTALAAAIGDAFVQLLWWRFRARDEGHSIEHVNALVSCHKSPLTLSVIPLWWSPVSPLVFIATLGIFMAAIPVWAPGALSIVLGEQADACTVRAPDLAAAHVGPITVPISNVVSFTSRAVIQGYLPPYRQCNQTCHFDVEYVAPALNCTDVSDSVDFNILLPPNILWNSSYTFNSSGLFILAGMATNAGTGAKEALECTAFNATYRARMDHSNISSSITLLSDPELLNPITTIIPDPGIDTGDATVGALADAFAYAINGSVDCSQYQFPAGSSIFQYTWMLYNAYHWNRTQNLTWIMPSLMENVSLSLSSGFLDLENYPPTTVPYVTTCYYPVNVYAYNNKHLWLPYGVCLAVSLFCGLLAFIAIQHDGDEFLDFARILGAVPRQGLTSTDLREEDRLKVDEKNGLLAVVRGV